MAQTISHLSACVLLKLTYRHQMLQPLTINTAYQFVFRKTHHFTAIDLIYILNIYLYNICYCYETPSFETLLTYT